jgi:hypothetical protein
MKSTLRFFAFVLALCLTHACRPAGEECNVVGAWHCAPGGYPERCSGTRWSRVGDEACPRLTPPRVCCAGVSYGEVVRACLPAALCLTDGGAR